MRVRHYLAVFCVALLFYWGGHFQGMWKLSWPGKPSYERDVRPILVSHCYDCHGDGMDKGGVALDKFADHAALVADVKFWEGVYHNVETQLMPPTDKPPLDPDEVTRLTSWIETEVFKLDPDKPDPGHVTVRRLNRNEYRNTIRDLVGDPGFDPAADLPPDDTGYGFDNIGDVLSMSPALFEKYVIAADKVLSHAIRTHPPEPGKIIREEEEDFRGVKHAANGTGSLASEGAVGTKIPVPTTGEYKLRIQADGDQAGNELPKMLVKFQGNKDMVFDVDAPRERPKMYEMPVKAEKGDRWVEMAFINDFYDPENPDPRRRDRNLHIWKVELVGPLNQAPPPPSDQQKALFAPANPKDPPRQQAYQIVRAFARKAWRRPVEAAEVERLLKFVELAEQENDSFESGVKLALQAVLVSPHFIFRGEAPSSAAGKPGIQPIGEHALASRLSYFLWNTTPDTALLDLADAGKLRENLDAQVERMLRDPRAEDFARSFAGQWLQLRNLDIVSPDPKTYRGWNDTLRRSMREESERFFIAILRENRPVGQFLDADFTFLNEPLARHYGIGNVRGEQFQRVSLNSNDRQRRGGILTQASILTITSNPTRTSPVNRGHWVLENLLGSPPPPPLDDVPDLEQSKQKGKELTIRQQLEIHREKPLCASCHARMDPIGFALENYDGIGAWRDKEGNSPIDSSGELYTGEKFAGAGELRKILTERKQEAFAGNLSKVMLTYALGRGVEYYDKPALTEIVSQTRKDDYRFQAMIHAIVNSVPFQYQRQ